MDTARNRLHSNSLDDLQRELEARRQVMIGRAAESLASLPAEIVSMRESWQLKLRVPPRALLLNYMLTRMDNKMRIPEYLNSRPELNSSVEAEVNKVSVRTDNQETNKLSTSSALVTFSGVALDGLVKERASVRRGLNFGKPDQGQPADWFMVAQVEGLNHREAPDINKLTEQIRSLLGSVIVFGPVEQHIINAG